MRAKAGAAPSMRAPYKNAGKPWGGRLVCGRQAVHPSLACKYSTSVEVIGSGKHSSLL